MAFAKRRLLNTTFIAKLLCEMFVVSDGLFLKPVRVERVQFQCLHCYADMTPNHNETNQIDDLSM